MSSLLVPRTILKTGAKLAFIIFRQRYQELQGIIAVKEGQVSENMVRFVEHLPAETIVICRATVQDPHSHGQSDIKYTSIHNVEVRIKTVSNRRFFPLACLFC
jgi:aspartyl/asparaginyl-tRNA synthetase